LSPDNHEGEKRGLIKGKGAVRQSKMETSSFRIGKREQRTVRSRRILIAQAGTCGTNIRFRSAGKWMNPSEGLR